MPLFDFFRKFLGLGSANEPPQQRFEEDPRYSDSFRNPIWQNDEDDDDVSDFSGRHPRYRNHFRIFSDPFEITRFFENQMDEMLNNFLGSFDGFGNRFGSNGRIIPFGNDDFVSPLPLPDRRSIEQGPRDEVLKPSHESGVKDFSSALPSFDRNSSGNACDEVLKPAYQMPDPHKEKLDLDIDGKLKSEELAKIWGAPPSKTLESYTPNFSFRSFGSSVSTQIVRRPDGSMEERRTVRDSDGNEEIRVTRQIGDKKHTIITKRDKDGSEVKTEDIVNMDESEFKGFDDRWTKIQVPSTDNDLNGFSWSKFFGPHPKL